MTEGEILASAVQIDITPPVGTPLEGYGARVGVSQGVHDPLYAQVLLLKSGEDQVALLSLDLLGVGLGFTHRVREAIEDAIGVPAEGILLAPSHIHSGPAGYIGEFPGFPFTKDPELQNIAVRQLEGAALWASQELQPASLGVGKGLVEGIGRNRNDPEHGPMDDELILLRVDDLDGRPIAVVMNYGCHPTVLSHRNLLISADFPGAARATLNKIFPETVFLFTNGASGDVSTRFTRREQTFNEVQRFGNMLAGEVLKVMSNVVTERQGDLASQVEQVKLPIRSFPSIDEAESTLHQLETQLQELKDSRASHGDIRIATTRVQGAAIQVELMKALEDRKHIETELQVLKLGPMTLIGLPGEPFVRTVLELKARSSMPFTAVVSYANDEVGYFPDIQSFQAGTYEALSSPYQEDVAEMLAKHGLAMLERS
ncbi:MAG: neutral/alkaline non-lysosomal ceramidase N-terminal domain-containing protein [Anaerolineaceae bacterium]|nr:MAG: neutral/alkaline non-lysosomal ceramidase N-terminal domain-containing protein [Anaerolineaceae bacterium]